MRIYLKIILIIILLLSLSFLFINETYALGDMMSSASGFLDEGKTSSSSNIDEGSLISMSKTVTNILTAVGVVVAVFYGIYIAIKMIVGSIEEKAKVKELLIPYIVGCIVVFGAFGIWSLVVDLLSAL